MPNILFYHPNCRASQKLLSIIPNDYKIEKIDITQLQQIPPQLSQVPTGQIDNKLMFGKELFDFFQKSSEGIKCMDIKKSSRLAGIIGSNSNITIDNHENLSQELDGFKGVPDFDESQIRSIDQMKSDRH